MFQSLYAFKSSHSDTLSFEINEQFLEIDKSKDPNWVHVININGNIGYVPNNYVTLNQIPSNQISKFVDACIDGIHLKASKREGGYLELENKALQILARKRQEGCPEAPFTLHPRKKPAPPPPMTFKPSLTEESVNSNTNDAMLPSSSKSTSSEFDSSHLPISLKMECSNHSNLKSETSNLKDVDDSLGEKEKNGCDDDSFPAKLANQTTFSDNSSLSVRQLEKIIPHDYYSQLVEQIRSVTNISFGASQQVVALILQSLGTTLTPLSPLFEKILQDSYKSQKDNFSTWETSGDGRKLADLLEKLRLCKDDDQQRSWALHEDEFIIKEHLNGILDVLINGDMDACNQVLMLSDYYPLLTLVQYYQMETRWTLQKGLLQIFSSICQMSKSNISYLSSSVLPLELAREIMDSNLMEDELKYIILVLGMILSMADALPVTHFSIMNETFINNLFQCIETYNQNPETEALAELYLTLLLAFNLQYHTKFSTPVSRNSLDGQKIEDRTENLVIKVLSSRSDTKYFIEKILILFNREEDPVRMFDHEPHPPHSVLAIIGDMFNCPTTAQFLYTNDEKVLCDIILRQLIDLSSEEKRRRQYLSLLEGVITLGKWKEHQHHREEFVLKLKYIHREENAPWENNIAARILNVLSESEPSQNH